MKYVSLFLLLVICYSSQAQDSPTQKNAVNISLFKIQNSSVTYRRTMAPLFVTGISYERRFSKWSWVTNIEYGENKIKDGCYGCPDGLYGTGILTELTFSSGYNFTLNQYSDSKFKWFFGTDFYVSSLGYEGELQGGWSGFERITVDGDYVYAGILQRVGVAYYPIPRLKISAISDYRVGWGNLDDFPSWPGRSGSETRITFPHLKVGFLF